MTTQVQVDVVTREVLAVGQFPTAPTTPGIVLYDLAESELPKFLQAGRKLLDAQGVITVVSPPPPPANRPKNRTELATDYTAAKRDYGTGTIAVGAANTQWGNATTALQQAAALRAATVALEQQITALAAGVDTLAKALAVLANDSVANS